MGEEVRSNILGMEDKLIESAIARDCTSDDSREWDVNDLTTYLENLCIHKDFVASHTYLIDNEDKDALTEAMQEDAHKLYEEREKEIAEIGVDMREFERVMLLRSVDRRWMDHIDAMDQLRDGIGYRAYSGKNPITEYQIEAGHMFEELNYLIREDTVRAVLHARIQRTPERVQTARPTLSALREAMRRSAVAAQAGQAGQAGQQQAGKPQAPAKPMPIRVPQKIGRIDPCPLRFG